MYGIVSPAEEAGAAALADDVRFLERPRHHHERQHWHRRRPETGDLRADRGEVLRRRRFELAGGADLVGGVAGVHLIDGRRMVEQADRGVAHRADHRELVGDLGELRQQLRELEAAGLRGNRLENALDVGGNIFLWVPQVEVAGAALEVDEDDALGFAEAGTAVVLLGSSRGSLKLEEAAETEAEDRRAADAQQIAARQAVTGIFPGPTWDHEHGSVPHRWNLKDGRNVGRCGIEAGADGCILIYPTIARHQGDSQITSGAICGMFWRTEIARRASKGTKNPLLARRAISVLSLTSLQTPPTFASDPM